MPLCLSPTRTIHEARENQARVSPPVTPTSLTVDAMTATARARAPELLDVLLRYCGDAHPVHRGGALFHRWFSSFVHSGAEETACATTQLRAARIALARASYSSRAAGRDVGELLAQYDPDSTCRAPSISHRRNAATTRGTNFGGLGGA